MKRRLNLQRIMKTVKKHILWGIASRMCEFKEKNKSLIKYDHFSLNYFSLIPFEKRVRS